MKKIKYYNNVNCLIREERCTEAETNSRLGDLRIMEIGGKVSSISIESEEEER